MRCMIIFDGWSIQSLENKPVGLWRAFLPVGRARLGPTASCGGIPGAKKLLTFTQRSTRVSAGSHPISEVSRAEDHTQPWASEAAVREVEVPVPQLSSTSS